MIPDELLGNDIKKYCIACLTKSQGMHNLNEQNEKRSMFTTVFNVELNNYEALPQFLCSVCDVKLNAMHNFQKAVRKCLAILQEYNDKLMVKEEVIGEACNKSTVEVDKCDFEEEAVQLKERVNQRATEIKIESKKLRSVNEVWIKTDDVIDHQKEEIGNSFVIKDSKLIESYVDHEEVGPSQDPFATEEHDPLETSGISGVLKNTSGRIINDGQKLMAFNVYTSYKNQGLSKSRSVALSASRSGISERTLWKIVKDMEIFGRIRSPAIKKNRPGMFNKLEKGQQETLREIIHSFLLRNEAPTLIKLKKAIEDEETLPSMKITTLWQTLRRMGIVWERRGGMRVLIEKPGVVL